VQHSLVEVHHLVRPIRRVRVVRHDQDRLVELGIEPPQQGEDLIRRFGVKITRGLIAEDDGRRG
jgi:hypothetical protein